MSDTPRAELEAVLKALLPDHWRIVRSERAVDITGTTLFLKQSKLRRSTVAGTGVLEIEFDVVLATDVTDADTAEDVLDDELTELLLVLDEHRVLFGEWEKNTFDDIGALGYRSTITITASKE